MGGADENNNRSEQNKEMIMKTVIAAIAVSLALASAVVPASANYIAPDASWQVKALAGTGY